LSLHAVRMQLGKVVLLLPSLVVWWIFTIFSESGWTIGGEALPPFAFKKKKSGWTSGIHEGSTKETRSQKYQNTTVV